MPRFYINFRSGGSTTNDDQGIECATLEDARKIALASAREVLADNIKSGSRSPLEAVIISSESGQELMTIPGKGCSAGTAEGVSPARGRPPRFAEHFFRRPVFAPAFSERP